jgi:hypothetical protein
VAQTVAVLPGVLWPDDFHPLPHRATATPELGVPILELEGVEDLLAAAPSRVGKGQDGPRFLVVLHK